MGATLSRILMRLFLPGYRAQRAPRTQYLQQSTVYTSFAFLNQCNVEIIFRAHVRDDILPALVTVACDSHRTQWGQRSQHIATACHRNDFVVALRCTAVLYDNIHARLEYVSPCGMCRGFSNCSSAAPWS